MNLFIHCADPCNLARAISEANSEAIKELYTSGELIPASPLLRRCPIGLTAKQALLIVTLSTREGVCITSHSETAYLYSVLWNIDTTKVAIRELVDKLRKRSFFDVCEAARDGIIQGIRLEYSAKCCPWLKLPFAPPHTPALVTPHTPDLPLTFTEAHTANATIAHISASAPLLQELEEDEEEKDFFTFEKEKRGTLELDEEFFKQVENNYAANWPHLMRVGFDFPAFKAVAPKVPDKSLFVETWAQSLAYADFAWKSPETVKDGEGKPIRTPHIWITGCFRRNSHYPRPANYKTPEELAVEARMEALRKEDEIRCKAAFPAWRAQQTEADIATLFECKRTPFPPEYIIEQRFQKTVWPELKNG
ncbi:hypothetical protein LJC23_07520 [Desulfovibrio sp. OttesenSCG-928-I05]|nr:hypothetical protein [Desulfovibrio sp. OttesenSCG-928-I05]